MKTIRKSKFETKVEFDRNVAETTRKIEIMMEALKLKIASKKDEVYKSDNTNWSVLGDLEHIEATLKQLVG